MLVAEWQRRELHFKELAITSRDRMSMKETYFVTIHDTDRPDVIGTGECALFRGLSGDDVPDYAERLDRYCRNIYGLDIKDISEPSIRFGIETALLDLRGGGRHILYDTAWSRGEDRIQVNGLIWMGDKETMYERILRKLESGFDCLKLKIGGIALDDEIDLLEYIRSKFGTETLTVRLDANGSLGPDADMALRQLERLSAYGIHSIEQPIPAGHVSDMSRIAAASPVDIALDEELIGLHTDEEKRAMLSEIRPQYIILKPTLVGGFAECDAWIDTARSLGIGWWMTSALESDIGLNAIAQYTSRFGVTIPQGLGTGQLYTDNVKSPLRLDSQYLRYSTDGVWERI